MYHSQNGDSCRHPINYPGAQDLCKKFSNETGPIAMVFVVPKVVYKSSFGVQCCEKGSKQAKIVVDRIKQFVLEYDGFVFNS